MVIPCPGSPVNSDYMPNTNKIKDYQGRVNSTGPTGQHKKHHNYKK